MPKLRAAMHLDTVFAAADRDCVLLYPDIVDSISTFSYRPSDGPSGLELHKEDMPFVDVVAEALNLVCASPGVVFAYDRNTYTNTLLRKAGIESSRSSAPNSAEVAAVVTA